MYRSLQVFAVVLLLASLTYAAIVKDQCKSGPNEFNCVKYLYNYDADTIKVDIPSVHWLLGKKISVRVLGVDSPEIHGLNVCEKNAAGKAKERVHELLTKAKRVDLKKIGRDKYFRILADVQADGQSVTQVLLKEGLAYPYNGGTKVKIDWCAGVK